MEESVWVHDFQSFVAMGGYAGYVWPAYGLTALMFVGMLVWTLRSLKARRRLEEELSSLGRSRRAGREARS